MSNGKVRPKSLIDIMSNPLMKKIQDRGSDISEIVKEITKNWEYDLDNRKPSPALSEDGIFKGTDLDLCTFMMSLASRKAVINLPIYNSRRPSIYDSNSTRVISKENRHGKLTGMVANSSLFSFSARILDNNVVVTNEDGSEECGEFRNFMITDFDGSWYSGWESFEWSPSSKENEFLNNNKLWTENTVVFKNFVAPQRWISLYGQHYFILKAAIQRITEECQFLEAQKKSMLHSGINWPASSDSRPQEGSFTRKEDAESTESKIEVIAYLFDVDVPDRTGEYFSPSYSVDNLVKCYETRKYLTYTVKPQLQFIARCIELAWVNQMNKEGTPNFFPAWIQNCKWEERKEKRTVWTRLILGQESVGELGFAIKYRTKKQIESVSSKSITSKDIVVG